MVRMVSYPDSKFEELHSSFILNEFIFDTFSIVSMYWILHEYSQFARINYDKSFLTYYETFFPSLSVSNSLSKCPNFITVLCLHYSSELPFQNLPAIFRVHFKQEIAMLCTNVITMLTFAFVLRCKHIHSTKLKSLTSTFVTSLDQHLINGNSCGIFRSCECRMTGGCLVSAHCKSKFRGNPSTVSRTHSWSNEILLERV